MLGDVQVICGSMIRESCQPQLKPWYITYVKILANVRYHLWRFYGNCQTLGGSHYNISKKL